MIIQTLKRIIQPPPCHQAREPHDIIAAIRQHRNLNGEPTRFTYLRRLVKTRPYVKTVMP